MALLNTAAAVRLGSAVVARVYAGAVQVWPPPPVGPSVLMAYRADWPAWSVADAVTGMTFTRYQASSLLGGGYIGQASTADADTGDAVGYGFDVDAGTYRLTMVYQQSPAAAILRLTVDGVSIGTVDQYHSAGLTNVATTVAGVVLGAGRHVLTLTAEGKNPAATDFYILPQWLSLDRTG